MPPRGRGIPPGRGWKKAAGRVKGGPGAGREGEGERSDFSLWRYITCASRSRSER